MVLIPSEASVRRSVAGKRPVLLACLPLLLALSTVFVFGHDLRSHIERSHSHSVLTHHRMSIAANLSLDHNFLQFYLQTLGADGTVFYDWLYNRFPIGGHGLIALAILPFGDDLASQLYAARTLMLLCFVATALLAYLCLCRLTHHPWIAATATLLAFSSFYCLYYADMVMNETGIDLLGVMLTFHGMVIFLCEGRFRQLLVKTCIALFLGWHVYALLLPFIALGVVREWCRARSVPFKLKCSRLLRSRYVLLGIVALLFGLSLLTFNFVNEYVALKGEKSLTELPSFRSMIYRMGIGTPENRPSRPLKWDFFLLDQFSRIGGMSTPYFILPSLGALRPPESYVPLSVGVGIGVFVSCLFGVYFTRPRILWATLVLFGFCWALPMRYNVEAPNHSFESVFYIGLPLVFFSLILLCLSRRFKTPLLMVGFAGAALIIFVLSSFQMSRFYAPDATQRQKVELSDVTAIRRLTADGDLIFIPFSDPPDLNRTSRPYEKAKQNYYWSRRIIHFHSLPAEGFTVMYDRLETDALLTPKNDRIFLYDSKKLLKAYRQAYQRVVSGEFVARSTFDVYRDEHALHYVKSPCSDADMQTKFFLHLFPTDARSIPVRRRWLGYNDKIFNFQDRGLRFDDKCLASIALPHYDIARIETGSLFRDSDPERLEVYRQAYQRVVSGAPVARSIFDVYRDDRTLYYVKSPCSDADVKLRFFLHIFPSDAKELPVHRRPYGYDNYDFDFSSQGQRFDDKCLAGIALPPYAIARIETGSLSPGQSKERADDPGRLEVYRQVYQRVVSGAPVARSTFDVYRDDRTLYYVKSPCSDADVKLQFFLHLFPADAKELPSRRWQWGYNNDNFSFVDQGQRFDDKCLASIALPHYAIARIETGQFHWNSGGKHWEAKIFFDEQSK